MNMNVEVPRDTVPLEVIVSKEQNRSEYDISGLEAQRQRRQERKERLNKITKRPPLE